MLTPEQGAEMHAMIAMALEDVDNGAPETTKLRLRRLQELVDDVVPDIDAAKEEA